MSGGLKYDNGKPDLVLIPPAALIEEGFVWTDGKSKYAAYNWHKGIAYNRILSAIARHYELLKSGIDFDYENRRHHAAAIRAGCAMLIQFTLENRTDLDDRMPIDEETKKKIEKMVQGESIFHILKEYQGEMK
jgi:hypothetical protein